MSEFGELKVRMGRKPVTVVELDLDTCANVYGTSPCTAAVGVTGAAKCFNTFKTCQDRANFEKRVKTYRLTTPFAPIPAGEQVFPCIESVSMAPTKLEMKGLSLRASISITCQDFPYHDRGLDPYVKERPAWQGTFFGKLKKRNPYVVNRPIRINTSYIGDDGKVYGETHHYLISSIDGPDSNGRVTIKARDALSLADENKAQVPADSSGKLVADISETADVLAMYPPGIWNEYPDAGLVRIGDEVIGYSGKRLNGLAGLQRGLLGTLPASHSTDDKVQACIQYDDMDACDLIAEWLQEYAGVDPTYIPLDQWREENRTWLGLMKLSGLLTEPKGVNKLIEEIQETTGCVVWWDERARLIRFKVIQVPLATCPPHQITDRNNLLKGSVKISEKEQDRVTRVSLFYRLTRQWDDVKEGNFSALHVAVNSDAESRFAYDEEKNRKVLSRWLSIDALADDVANRILARFQNPNKEATFRLDAKDADINTGDIVDITARLTPNDDGSDGGVRLLVTERKEVKTGSHFEYTGYEMGTPGVLARVFAPDDCPDWADATPEQRAHYLWFTDDDGKIDGEFVGGVLV